MLRLITVILVVMSMFGCGGYIAHPPASIPDGKQVYSDQVVYLGRDYVLSPGDEIEILYHVSVEVVEKYQLAIGDQIRVEFLFYPQLDRTLDVRPDGRITIPYKGDISAVGLTPEELAKKIDAAYVDLLKQPKSTVSLVRFGQRIRELKEAIKTAPRGQSRLVVVQPDGKISPPLVPPFMVAGMTIDQAEREINRVYKPVIPGMFTSTSLLAAKGNIFYAFGAVGKPGFYELKGPTTVLQGIAIAGGFTPAAEASSTLLITRDERNQAVGRLVNSAQILSTGNIGKDVLLRQADVVFVPNTKLSEASLIGSYIRSLIPVNLSFTYGLNQNVTPDIRF